MRKRLLHVFATFQPAGPQLRAVRLIEGLGTDWEHMIVAMDGSVGARELLPPDARVRLLPPPARRSAPAVVRWAWALVQRERPDLCLSYNWGSIEALLGARLARAAVVHHEDGFLPDEAQALKRRRNWTRRLLLRGARAIIVPSYGLQRIARELWHVPAKRLHVVPNGVELARFGARDEGGTRAQLGIPADALVIGSVGHLRREKNPLRLLRAFARLGDAGNARLLLLGDGPERGALEAAVREHGLGQRVHMIGHRQDAHAYYGAMDVFAFGSDTEQMPVALLEAMASCLPVAGTDVGDVRRMLGEGQGDYLVGIGDEQATDALAAALDALLASATLRTRLGRANRERVARDYTFEGMLTTYRGLYEACLLGDIAPGGREG